MDKAVAFTTEYFGARKAVGWNLPRGAFSDIKTVRRDTKIFEAGPDVVPASGSAVFRPRLAEAAEVFKPSFKLPVETGFSPAFELILDIYGCDFDRISSCEVVAAWARESAKLAGLKTIGKPEAPDFGHAKKKTAGPSVTQLLRGGSNISHYSINWLMIVVNLVAREADSPAPSHHPRHGLFPRNQGPLLDPAARRLGQEPQGDRGKYRPFRSPAGLVAIKNGQRTISEAKTRRMPYSSASPIRRARAASVSLFGWQMPTARPCF
ncbi:MAG: hypothetical protein M0C28_32070 [Candidatus Moduliflexus flocculans]|nr:hypothetical protein [Candidatus Moduliflexus flocculans]